MTVRKPLLLLVLFPALAACSSYPPPSMERIKDEGVYWQRANVSEAVYLEGPKAQQMLHRDIANCVTTLREMDRLGALRNALPGEDTTGGGIPDPNTPYGKLNKYDSPERDSYLLAEHSNYDDFETCMLSHGWERMEHVPYSVAKASRVNYLESITGQRYHEKTGEYEPADEAAARKDRDNDSGSVDYDSLNH